MQTAALYLNIKKQPAAAFFSEYQSQELLFKQIIEPINDSLGDGIRIVFEIKGQNQFRDFELFGRFVKTDSLFFHFFLNRLFFRGIHGVASL